jgi:anti-sigma factor RsiW
VSADAYELPCADARALLGPFVDGELSGEGSEAESLAIEQHLRACEPCAGEVRALRQIKHHVRAAAARQAPESLRRSLTLALADAEPPAAGRGAEVYRFLVRARPSTVALAASAAGVAAWFLLGGLTHAPFKAEGAKSPLVDDGVALHARTLPLDYAASDATLVQRYLERQLQFGVRLPRFEQAAAHQTMPCPALQGARLSTLHARPAAMVTYTVPEADGRRVTLLIVDDPSGSLPGTPRAVGGRDVFISQARGYNVAAWRSGEIVYSLISDLDEGDVLRLVAQANR